MPKHNYYYEWNLNIHLCNRSQLVWTLRIGGLQDPLNLSTFQVHLGETKTTGVLTAQISLTTTYTHEDVTREKYAGNYKCVQENKMGLTFFEQASLSMGTSGSFIYSSTYCSSVHLRGVTLHHFPLKACHSIDYFMPSLCHSPPWFRCMMSFCFSPTVIIV